METLTVISPSSLRPVSQKSRQRFGKLFCVCRVYIQDQSSNNFENDAMKLSVNEAKLTKNCATIQQVLILKFAFGPETFPGLSRNGAPDPKGLTMKDY